MNEHTASPVHASEPDRRAERIRDILSQKLAPLTLDIVNSSAAHRGHAGDDGSGETHYAVHIVSDSFRGMTRIQAHRHVHRLLAREFAHGLHALQLKTGTPSGG